jgi:hypothetical protein
VLIRATPPSDPPVTMVKVKITATTDVRGKYWGVISGGVSSADDSTALTEPEGMTDGTTTVLVMNLSEDVAHIFKSGQDHMLELNEYYLGKLVGVQTDGVQIVEIDCERCGIQTTPELFVHHDGAEAAYSDHEESAARNNLNLSVVARVAYNASGDKILYAFYRDLSFACGKLVSVGAEQRVSVFTTGPCP